MTKMSSDECVEEMKNAFNTTASIEATKEPPSAQENEGEAVSGEDEADDNTTQQSPTKPKKKSSNNSNQKLVLCTFATRYNVIKRVVRKMDFKLNEDVNFDWDLYWSDTGVQPE